MATDTSSNRQRNIVAPIRAGKAAGCPFCIVRLSPEPEPGTRVRMLSGFRTGIDGTIAPLPPDYPDHPNGPVIMMHYDADPLSYLSLDRIVADTLFGIYHT